ncbi:MAG: ABC transporter permease, partial [candidate division NC10 bacterium]
MKASGGFSGGWPIRLGQIGLLVIGLTAAEWSVRTGLVGDLYVASPTQVLREFTGLLTGYALFRHLAVTLKEFAVGFAAACLLGMGIGVLLARVKSVETFARPYLSALMAVPKVVIVPLLTIWLGIGLVSKAALVFLFSFFPVLYNTMAGVKQTGENHLKVARVFGASRLQILTKVILPSAVPTLFAGLRVAAPAGLLGALFGEMLASKEGLGNVLTKAAQLYNTLASLLCADAP